MPAPDGGPAGRLRDAGTPTGAAGRASAAGGGHHPRTAPPADPRCAIVLARGPAGDHHYVPNIGSIIAAVPAVLLALIQLGPGPALAATGAYVVINIVMGNVVEPRFMGRGLGLSTLVVFLSLVVWGALLGPVGMFLSVPLTMTAKLALEANPQTHWIAVLLSPADAPEIVEPVKPSEAVDEAADQA